LLDIYSAYTKAVADFNTAKSTFSTSLTAYDAKVKERNAVIAAPDSATDATGELGAKVVIPDTPCPPNLPYNLGFSKVEQPAHAASYAIDVSTATNWETPKLGKGASLKFVSSAANDNAIRDLSFGMGSLYTTKNDSNTCASGAMTDACKVDVGHVFGRLGQGDRNMPGIMEPYLQWNVAAASKTGIPGMYVGVFPMTNKFTMASGAKIEIEASSASPLNVDVAAPTAAAGTPTKLTFISAQNIALGLVASAAVAINSLI